MSFIVTKEWIEEYTLSKKNICSITNPQLKILGQQTKSNKGWKLRVIGTVISDASEKLFRELHGVVGKKQQQILIDEFKEKQERNRIGVPKPISSSTIIKPLRKKMSSKLCKEKHNRLVNEERDRKSRQKKIIVVKKKKEVNEEV